MKYLDSILPKIYDSVRVKNYQGKVDTKNIFGPSTPIMDLDEKAIERELKGATKLFYVLPLGMFFADCEYYLIPYLKKAKNRVFNVFVVDYSSILNKIHKINGNSIHFSESNGVESYNVLSPKLIQKSIKHPKVTPFEFYNMNETGKLNESIESSLNEAFGEEDTELEELLAKNYAKEIKDKVATTSTIVYHKGEEVRTLIREVLTNDNYTEIPHLIGVSGVMKSQIVKNFANEIKDKNTGLPKYRYVEFRLSFMDKFDITGLIGKVDIHSKEYKERTTEEEQKAMAKLTDQISFDAVQSLFVECSDQFIEYCTKYADSLQKYFHDKEKTLSSSEKQYVKDLIETYRGKARPALMFFDEFTRMRGSMTKILMTLFSQARSLNELTFHNAKMICASNIAPTEEWDGKLRGLDLFNATLDSDPAFKSRLKPVAILIKDVKDMWLDWARSSSVNADDKSKSSRPNNIHPVILRYVKEHIDKYPDLLYNLDLLLELRTPASEGSNDNPMTSTPHPNYRAFTQLSDYLYGLWGDSGNIGKEPVSTHIVLGFIGDENILGGNTSISKIKAGRMFIAYLKGLKNPKVSVIGEDDSNMYDDLVSSCINHNTPILLVGPSGVGKSARILSQIKREEKSGRRIEVVNITLGSATRDSISGAVEKMTLDRYVKMKSKAMDTDINEERKGQIIDEFKTHTKFHFDSKDLPALITAKVPNKELLEKMNIVKRDNEEGRNSLLYIFIDEVNRVVDPVMMSCVFELISDGRFKGVDLDMRYVRVALACNLGANMDVKELDQALIARFCVAKKLQYDLDDVKGFLNYINSENNFYNPLKNFFNETADESDGPQKILEWLKAVDKADYQGVVPSSRAINNLSEKLMDRTSYMSIVCTGFTPFTDSMSVNSSNVQKMDKLLEKILEITYPYEVDSKKYDVDNFSNLNKLIPLFSDFITPLEKVLKEVKHKLGNWNLLKFNSNLKIKMPDGKIREIRVADIASRFMEVKNKEFVGEGFKYGDEINDGEFIKRNFHAYMKLVVRICRYFYDGVVSDILLIENFISIQRKNLLKEHLDSFGHTDIVDKLAKYLVKTGLVIDETPTPEWLMDMDKIEEYFNRTFVSGLNVAEKRKLIDNQVFRPLDGFVSQGIFSLTSDYCRVLLNLIMKYLIRDEKAKLVLDTFLDGSFQLKVMNTAENQADRLRWVSGFIVDNMSDLISTTNIDNLESKLEDFIKNLNPEVVTDVDRPVPQVVNR